MNAISDQQLETLFDYFESEQRSEDCLDFFGVYGMLTAANITPMPISEPDLLNLIFDGTPDWSDSEQQTILPLLELLYQTLGNELVSEDAVDLPFDIEQPIEDTDMQAWCCGFLSLVFAQQDDWFYKDEQTISTLLYPIEVGSGLFDDETEFQQLANNQSLQLKVLEQIPEVLIDLYLFFHAPVEKSAPVRSAKQKPHRKPGGKPKHR